MGAIADRIRRLGRQSAVPSDDGAGVGYIDEREQAIINRHTSEAKKGNIFQKAARGAAKLEIAERRQWRSYAEQAPPEIAEPVKEMLSNLDDRAKVRSIYQKLTPEQRQEALRLVPGISQQLGDDRGGAVGRTLKSLRGGIANVIQPGMELVGTGGTPEEIEFIRQLEAAESQEFAPALPSDPWYERFPLQAAEMVPFMAATGAGNIVGSGIAKAGGNVLARGAAAGVPGAKTALQAAGAVGKLPTAVGLPAATAQATIARAGGAAGITAVGFPGQYAQEVDQLKELGVEDGPGMQALAVGTSLVSSALEAIMPNPFKGVLPAGAVSIRDGATTAARQYLWEAIKRAPPEISEEYAQGLASGLGKTVASYLDMTTKDVSVGDAFATSFEQGNAAIGPMAFLLGVPALAGAGAVGFRARAGTPPGPPPPVTQAPPVQPQVVAPSGIPPTGTLPEVTPPVDQTDVVPPAAVPPTTPTTTVPPDQSQRLARLQEIRRKGFVSEDEAIEVGTGGKNRKERLANLEKAIEQEASQGGAAPPVPSLPQGVPDESQVQPNEESTVQGQARVQGEQEARIEGGEQQAVKGDAGTEVQVGKPRATMAVMTSDGKIYSDPESQMHADVVEKFGLDSYDIIDGGFIIDGKYKMAMSDGGYAATEGDDEQVDTVKRYADEYNAKVTPASDVAQPPVTPEPQQTEATTAPYETTTTGARRMEPTEEGRPADGKPIMPGDRFLTNTGRETTPYPKYSGSTNRQAIASEKKSQLWLMENAIAEAESRGDDFNLNMFRGELEDAKKGKLPQASKDSATLYVFGEWIPAVPKPFLKPLVEKTSENSKNDTARPDKSSELDSKPVTQPEGVGSSAPTTRGAALPAAEQARENLRKRGKKKPSQADLDAETAVVIRERESDNKVRQDFQADRDAQKTQEARREFVSAQKALANPATVDSMSVGDIAQVNDDIERGRVSYEDAVKVADAFVAAGHLPQGKRDKIRKPEPTGEQDTGTERELSGNRTGTEQPEAGVPTTTAEQKPAEKAQPDRVQQIQDTFKVNREVAIVADILADATSPPGEVEIASPGTPIPDAETLFQKDTPRWYSKARALINEKMGPKASAQQVLNMLKKNGVKEEELQWSGLEELLGGEKSLKSVTKEEVLAALDNGFELKEVVLPDSKAIPKFDDVVDHAGKSLIHRKEQNKFQVVISRLNENRRGSGNFFGDTLEEAMDKARTEWDKVSPNLYEYRATQPKFGTYTLPGGENYKELLLTLPEQSLEDKPAIVEHPRGEGFALQYPNGDYVKSLSGGQDRTRTANPSEATRWDSRYLAEAGVRAHDTRTSVFKSSHYDEPNIVAHIRFNERTDADGKKVLFLEEVQSDWHQEGRKKGYAVGLSADESSELESLIQKNKKLFEDMKAAVKNGNDDLGNRLYDERIPVLSKIRELEAKRDNKNLVPDAPFKKTWHMLAMKRAIQYAAENGFDRVAWTTGEQQADRYDLSKQVKEIEYIKHNDGYELGVTALDGEGVRLPKDRYTENELDDVVGKEVAERIVKGEGTKHRGHRGYTLSGDNLKVGGEGMKAFYDKMLPNEVNKFIKKFGANVGQTQIPSPQSLRPIQNGGKWYLYDPITEDTVSGDALGVNDSANSLEFGSRQEAMDFVNSRGKAGGFQQPSFDITPKMRDSALTNGQPLFQKQRDPQGDIQAWTHFVNASKAIIGATNKADVSSFFHEWAHPLRKFLFNREVSKEDRGNITDDDILKIEEFVGVKDGNWTRENEEGFVDALMSYWMEGKSPTPELETVFQKISAWLSKVISVIQRQVPLNDEVRAIFDKVHRRGGVDPKKLKALKEAEVSEKSDTAEESAEDSEAEFDDVFADVFEEEATVAQKQDEDELASLRSAQSEMYNEVERLQNAGKDREANALIREAEKLTPRIKELEAPIIRAKQDAEIAAREDRNKAYNAKEDARKAALPTKQTRNGWELATDSIRWYLRDPNTKEIIYEGKLTRVREVADEAPPDVPSDAPVSPDKGSHAKAEFIELKGQNAPGVKQTIRVIAGERTLLMERSKHDSEWSIKEPDEYTGEVEGKAPVKTKGEILASGIVDTKKAKEIAQQIIDGTFDKDADTRFVLEDTQNIGLTNAGLADSIKDQLQRKGSFAKLLREDSLFTDGRLLLKVNEKDRDAILKRVGETDEGRSLGVVAQIMTDGKKALSRSANAMKPIGFRGGDITTRTVVLQSQDGDAVMLDKALHDTVLKKHPDAVPYFLEKGRPISYASNSDVVAIVMPMSMDKPDARLKKLITGEYDFDDEAAEEFTNKGDTLYQANVDIKRQAAQLAKDALEGGAKTFDDYVDYAVQEIGADKVKEAASVMEGFWDYLRTRKGYDHLPEAGKVADVLAEKAEPAKPEKPKPEPKPKQPEKPAEKPTGRFFPRVPGVRNPGKPFPEVEPEPYEPHELTGMAKAVMNDLRELAGIPELEAAPPETIEQWALDAQSTMAADPHAATRLLNDIIANPARALDHHDVMLLAFRYRALVNEAEPHFQELKEANASGNAERIAQARTNYIIARQPVTEFEELTLKAKSTWGRTGIAIQVLLRRDNTPAGLMRRAREANHGKPLTPEQEIEMRDLADRFAAVQKKLDEALARADKAEAEVASLRHLKELVKESPTRKRPSKEQKSELDKSWADIAKLANVNVLFQRDAKNPFHNNVQVYRDLGVETFAELRRHVQERLGKEQAAKLEDKFKEAWEATKPETEVPANIDRGNLAQLTREARRIERSIVEGLMLDHSAEAVLEMRDEIVNAVYAEMQELLDESFTHRQTMDALSGYGQFSRPSQDTTDTLLRNLNAEVLKLRQIDQLGDAVARTEQLRAEGKSDAEIADTLIKEGLLVAQTGLVRDTPTDRLRDLNRKYSELKKDIPASSEGRAGLLQTAIAAIERGLSNRIRDLNHALSQTPPEPIKIGRKPSPTNENIERLREERDALLKEYRKLFPAEKKKLTPEQRLANAIKAAERSIEVLEKQIATRNFDKQEQEALPESPELTELRERLEHLRDQRNVAKALELSQWESEGGAVGPDPKEAAYRKAYIASLSNRIAKLQQFLREGDFSPQEKKLPRILSKEELDLKRQLAELNTEKLKKMADYHLKNLKGIAWTADKISEVLHLARAVETMADLSALGRQGGLIAMGRPALAKNALVGVIKSMAQAFDKSAVFNKRDLKLSELEQFLTGIDSRKAELAFMHQLTEGEWAEFRILAGLDLPSTDQAITRQEEVFQGRWGKYFPGVAISSRLYTMILNKMRADMFDLMVEKLGRQGKPTLEEAKLIASFVNVMTGRSDLKQFNSHAATLNNVFFAPRYVASRFQYLAMPFYLPFKGGVKANWQIKRAIYREYARTASGAMLTLGLISMAGYLFWDDDDEDKPTVGFDPTTSDFLKPKFGETRLDFLAGLQQVFVLSARMLPEELGGGRIGDKKYGEGGPYAQSRATVIARFLRTKLAPGPGYIVTGLNDWENVIGEKADRVFGLKVHPAIGTTTNLFFPLSMQSVADAFETQPVPVAAGASILSILGVGMSTYGPKTEYMTGTPEERQKQIEGDLENLEWDAPNPPYSEFLTKEQLDQFEKRRTNRVGLKLSQAISDPESELGKKTRDKALELIKESKLGRTRAEAIKAYTAYWQENNSKNGKKASTHEIVDGSRVMKAALRKGINKVKALYRD